MIFEELFDFAEKLALPKEYKPPPDPIDWMTFNFVDPISEKLIILTEVQSRIIREALTLDKFGYSKYDTVIWSQPKKSGKTTIAAAVGAYVAANIEPPNEICCLANDQEQSAGRIFGNMMPTMKRLDWEVPVSQKGMIRQPMAYGPNGTFIKAITTNYEKEAGSNQGISLWSELWAYKGERLNRLWDEMTPPPTRKFSMRWVETYAGFINESVLLQNLYLSVFTDFKETGIQQGVIKLWDDLPVYAVDGHILVFWDHEHRMPWQTQKYYDQQKSSPTMRASTFKRLHGNYWVESSERFITYDMWQKSIRGEVKKGKAVYALDASKNIASTALVGCVKRGDQVYTTDINIWMAPTNGEINFKLVEETIYSKWKMGLIQPPLYYDPYQCVKLAQDLRNRGLPCEEFPQGIERIKADTTLFKLYKEGKIINPDNSLLRDQVTNATAKDYDDDRVRIVRPLSGSPEDEKNIEENEEAKATMGMKNVDAVIAQSMAAYRAYHKSTGGWGATTKELNADESN